VIATVEPCITQDGQGPYNGQHARIYACIYIYIYTYPGIHPVLGHLGPYIPPRWLSNMSSTSAIEKPTLTVQGDGEKETAGTAPSYVSDDSFTNPTGINEKAFIRRLDWKLLPPLTLLYLLSFLDRSNSMFPPMYLE
jgi:hypothetical protein